MKLTIDTKSIDKHIANLLLLENTLLLKPELLDDLGTLRKFLNEVAYGVNTDHNVVIESIKVPEVPKGRMTIRELMEYEIDIDIANNVTDSLGCCLVCPMKLTEEGEREWGDVLDYVVDVYGDDNYAECIVDDDPHIKWQTKNRRLESFLLSAAGYCSETDYDKWFVDEF